MDDPGLRLADCRVAIVGLGLMGGSLALALREHCREIIGVEAEPGSRAFALAHHFIGRAADFGPALAEADLVVLATPVRTILSQLTELASAPRPTPHSNPLTSRTGQHRPGGAGVADTQRSTLLDLGSTKSAIVSAMQALPGAWDPLGGHPMCGKETGGIQNAEAGLYRGRTFVLCPLERTSPGALALGHQLVQAVGAQALVLDPARHDALAALISHLPYAAAAALMRAALAAGDEAAWRLAASGFRDTTRLAASDLTMMMDILLTNRAAMLDALAAYRGELDQVAAAIESGDPDRLRAVLQPAQQARSQLFK